VPTAALGVAVGAPQFSLLSATAITNAPFCLGFAFRRGDIPSGRSVVSDYGSLQVTPRNYWPDGSLKFAQLAGQATLQAGVAAVISLRKGTAAAGAALGLAELKATGITAQLSCGSFGSAAWSAADWDTPFETWVSGPVMSSWIYRKPVGTDAHLVAWLEVRLFAGGAVEVLPWIENGFLRVAGPTIKSANYSFTLGGTPRFSATINLKHHQRTPLVSGTALSHWLGTDPALSIRHDTLYMQATELVPSYYGTVDTSALVVVGNTAHPGLASSYTPLQQGNFDFDGSTDSMPASGYQPPLGLLPQHDVLYLTTNLADSFAAVVRNGYSAGRYGIHYRDEATNRPPKFSSWPTLVFADGQGFKDTGASSNSTYTAAASGGNPPTWDTAHSPSVGFMAYLLTGRFYFKEEVQFAAIANHFNVTDWIRGGGRNFAPLQGYSGASGICVSYPQTRTGAWWLRTLAQALAVTPDTGDPLRADFVASVEANCNYFHQIYVAQPNNPFGFIEGGGSYGYIPGAYTEPIWEQDFSTGAWGYALAMGLPISATATVKMQQFFAWKARSVIGRLGPQGEFWYVNAAPYTIALAPSAGADFFGGTGPWYPNWAAVYAATFSIDQGAVGRSDGTLALDFPASSQPSMWHNLQPAIAYAVRHGVAGALAAYNRMTAANNWSSIQATWNERPVWGIKPAAAQPLAVTQGLPAWMSGTALYQWIEIPGTAGAGGAPVTDFSGFALKEDTSEIIIAAAGGHGGSRDNRVVSLSLAADAPSWTLRHAPSPAAPDNVAYNPDGQPASRHTYQSSCYVPAVDRVMLFGCNFTAPSAYQYPTVDGFNLNTNSWDPAGSHASLPPGAGFGMAVKDGVGNVWTNGLFKWTASSNTWSSPITNRSNDLVRFPIAYDPTRNQLFCLQFDDGQGLGGTRVFASRVPAAGNTQYTVSFNDSSASALAALTAEAPALAGMDYDPVNDQFLFYCGYGAAAGTVYVIKPNTSNVWDLSVLRPAGAVTIPAWVTGGLNGRLRYVPALRGFVVQPGSASNLYFLRTSA
jgi:hypothetical protein